MPSNILNTKKRLTITAGEALQVLMGLEKKTLTNLRVVLREKGHEISHVQLKKWSAAYKWSVVSGKAATPSIHMVETTLTALSKEGARLTDEHFIGLQAMLVTHLAEEIRTIELKTPKDVLEMTEAIDKMRGMAHAMRGDKFTETAGKQLGDAAAGKVVNLGGFKNKSAPGPNGSTNGHG